MENWNISVEIADIEGLFEEMKVNDKKQHLITKDNNGKNCVYKF